ncbi:hypothetical protein [Sandarakinorhabdus sp.]|nr:hypothetical protein [Sandarakinorhabdus sp.]
MGIALALFGWSPQAWRRSTPHEFWAAFDAWEEAHQPPETGGAS